MKLVIHEPQWARYTDRLLSLAGPAWKLVCTRDTSSLAAELTDADALLALEMPRECMESARGLQLFLFPGAGPIRTDPADYPRGCAVTTVSEHGVPVAEYVMAAILQHVTGMSRYAASFRDGNWEGSGRTGGQPHDEAFGKTVGLVGYGAIGQAVAARAKAFGMDVLAMRRSDGPDALPRLLAPSDFLVIAAPLTDATRGMIGEAELQRMKPSAVLINVSRAEIVDEDALYNALRECRIAGAALDVWYQYPARAEDRMHGSRLPFHELPGVIATPHLSAWTEPLIARRLCRMAENLRRLSAGEPLTSVLITGTYVS